MLEYSGSECLALLIVLGGSLVQGLLGIGIGIGLLAAPLTGFCSGLMGTATSVGGPPMALVYQRCNRINARDELAAFFLLTTPVSVLFLLYQGHMPPATCTAP